MSRPFSLPFRLSPLALLIAGLGVWAAPPLYAADDRVVAELQAEVARLKKELASSRQGTAPAAAPAVGGEGQATTVLNAAKVANASPAKADEPQALDTVVVRSRNLIERLQDVPLSISVVSGKELERELSQDLGAITNRTGNVSFNQSNTRGGSLSIRGVGKRSFNETQDPSVGLIVDGVSYGLTQLGNFDFYDIESVDVARGPQGTLLGKGASSGAVTVTSKAPSFTPSADYQVAYGQRDTLIAKGALGGPIVEDLLAWRGAFVVNKGRGFYGNAYNDNYTLYNKDRVSARTQFLLTPSADVTAKFSFDVEPRAPQLQNGLSNYIDTPSKFADGSLTDPSGTTAKAKLYGFTNSKGVFTGGRSWFSGRNFSYYGNYLNGPSERGQTNFNQNEGQVVSTRGASADINWTVGNHTLTSITAYRNYTFDARNDEGTPFDISKYGGGGVFYSQYSQEFRDSAKISDLFDYQAGLFFLKTDDRIESKTGWGADAGAWFATAAQYATLDSNAGANRGAGLALLKDSLADGFKKSYQQVNTQSNAAFGQGNWHLSPVDTVTTGLRVTNELRSTADQAALVNNGVGGALNPVSVRGVQLGGFNSASNGDLGSGNSASQLSLADTVANRYFGSTITATPGDAYKSLSVEQKAQVAAAKALRAGQIGAIITGIKSTYNDRLYSAVISPSHKFNDNLTGYVSWQYGEKSGSALNVNGVAANVKPEKTNSYEVGLKSFLFDKTLALNADIFLMDIKDYQQTIRAVDEFQTQTNIANNQANPLAYLSVQGNVNKVRVKGLEVDGVYSGLGHTTIRFSGAYNDARYIDFKNAAKPAELAYLSANFIDQSGKTLTGAPKLSFNIGAEYRRQVGGNKVFHTSFNTAITSRYNNDETLSEYSWVPGRSVTDASIGFGSLKKGFDLNLVVKNLFDNRAHEPGWASYEPNPYPRWVGLVFSGSL